MLEVLQIMILRHKRSLDRIVLIGVTSKVGDPREVDEGRVMLTEEKIQEAYGIRGKVFDIF
jgi:hypothetical protein